MADYTCFLNTSLAVLVNRSINITQSDEKSKHRDVLYVCADYPYYSCLFAFSTAIPTSLSNIKHLVLYLFYYD